MATDFDALLGSITFVDEMYERYQKDPAGVEPSWRSLFDNGHATKRAVPQTASVAVAPTVSMAATMASVAVVPTVSMAGPMASVAAVPTVSMAATQPNTDAHVHAGVWNLVDAYRTIGHLHAKLDPLELLDCGDEADLDPEYYGLDKALDRAAPTGGFHGVSETSPRDLIARLQATYCQSIGLEFMHLTSRERKHWLAWRMETSEGKKDIDPDTRRAMLQRLAEAEVFESFVHTKFIGSKRFSLEGAESLMPLLDLVIEHAARLGAVDAIIGMSHRGRLNVLCHTMGKGACAIFAEFEDIDPEAVFGGGDVKYHMGFSTDHTTRAGHDIHLSLAFNPSHLEAVDPVVVGRVRAKQRRHQDTPHDKVVGILLHGDAAFAGQGLVPETLNMAELHGYRTGGTVHIIVNNQIGFTTSPTDSRSTPYATDVAKMSQCPIFHVNGEDLEAVAYCVELAMEYRKEFKSDVVIDMFCYRKYGHNESDEPGFTQPLLYERIRKKRTIFELYGEKLVAEGLLGEEDLKAIKAEKKAGLQKDLQMARTLEKRPQVSAMGGRWSDYVGGWDKDCPEADTGFPLDRLQRVATAACTIPEGFSPHPKVKKLYAKREAMGRGEQPIDWGMAEILAYGSLAWDGTLVRLSGEDSTRGTFSHRHAALVDMKTGEDYCPLAHMHDEQGDVCIYDSPLSELGVLGFEFGFSLDYPDALVLWEAQFGDFVNGAQVILDQFISSSEDKWKRVSGLTMFLPHGYEGQGPEHSSARFERFLQMCAEDNMQIVQPTTPAQMFHMLRRQVVRKYRKPLVVMTPKSLLRHPQVVSSMEDLAQGGFSRVLSDPEPPASSGVTRVLLCTGKVFYDLAAERKARGDTHTAIVRLEQLYPWNDSDVQAELDRFPGLRELLWVQEEPENMGAYRFVEPRLRAMSDLPLRAVSREASASPATGSHKAHAIEQRALIDEAFASKGQ